MFGIVPVMLAVLYGYFNHLDSKSREAYFSIYTQVGKPFQAENFINTSGNSLRLLDFRKTPITIVDFWFKECLPCINEMKQFPDLLKGKENTVRVISVSFNSYLGWKQLFDQEQAGFSFLKQPVPNWQHVVLQSREDPSLGNELAADRVDELRMTMGIRTCPAYFIVDSTGTIKNVSYSAIRYITGEIEGKNLFISFLLDAATWRDSFLYYLLILFFLAYSGIFFLISLFVRR